MFPNSNTLFHPLQVDFDLVLPKQFTFPFYYEPHTLSIKAAEAVQTYLENQTDFNQTDNLLISTSSWLKLKKKSCSYFASRKLC